MGACATAWQEDGSAKAAELRQELASHKAAAQGSLATGLVRFLQANHACSLDSLLATQMLVSTRHCSRDHGRQDHCAWTDGAGWKFAAAQTGSIHAVTE